MKKIAMAVLLSAFVAAPAFAAGAKNNIGVNYSLDGALGLQGEFNITPTPISVQAFYKKETETAWFTKYDHKAIGVAGIYDLSTAIKIDKNATPFVGLGLARETASSVLPFWGAVEATTTELYFTGGLRYAFSPQLSGEASYNNIFDLTVGLNFNF